MQHGQQLGLQMLQSRDPLANRARRTADPGLEVTAGAEAKPPRPEDLPDVRQRQVHGPKGANQGQLRQHRLGKQPEASLAAADGMDQTLIAIEANGLDREPLAPGYCPDSQGSGTDLTLHWLESEYYAETRAVVANSPLRSDRHRPDRSIG